MLDYSHSRQNIIGIHVAIRKYSIKRPRQIWSHVKFIGKPFILHNTNTHQGSVSASGSTAFHFSHNTFIHIYIGFHRCLSDDFSISDFLPHEMRVVCDVIANFIYPKMSFFTAFHTSDERFSRWIQCVGAMSMSLTFIFQIVCEKVQYFIFETFQSIFSWHFCFSIFMRFY